MGKIPPPCRQNKGNLKNTILPKGGTITDTKILEELEAAYAAEELNLVASNLRALEAAVKAKMQQVGQGLLQRLVQRHPMGIKVVLWLVTAVVQNVL